MLSSIENIIIVMPKQTFSLKHHIIYTKRKKLSTPMFFSNDKWYDKLDIGCPVVIAAAISDAMLLPTDECFAQEVPEPEYDGLSCPKYALWDSNPAHGWSRNRSHGFALEVGGYCSWTMRHGVFIHIHRPCS